jgi:hypothetical protein
MATFYLAQARNLLQRSNRQHGEQSRLPRSLLVPLIVATAQLVGACTKELPLCPLPPRYKSAIIAPPSNAQLSRDTGIRAHTNVEILTPPAGSALLQPPPSEFYRSGTAANPAASATPPEMPPHCRPRS